MYMGARWENERAGERIVSSMKSITKCIFSESHLS